MILYLYLIELNYDIYIWSFPLEPRPNLNNKIKVIKRCCYGIFKIDRLFQTISLDLGRFKHFAWVKFVHTPGIPVEPKNFFKNYPFHNDEV